MEIGCIISFLYIKPQLEVGRYLNEIGCIISFLYIKPQLYVTNAIQHAVVLYRFSTSNHNGRCLYLIFSLLYYIVSLHQTTTRGLPLISLLCCIISFLYIKPQLEVLTPLPPESCIISFLYIKPQREIQFDAKEHGCIISFLYIKPQPNSQKQRWPTVVLYRFSTSNHNFKASYLFISQLYYIVSLHQTTTF